MGSWLSRQPGVMVKCKVNFSKKCTHLVGKESKCREVSRTRKHSRQKLVPFAGLDASFASLFIILLMLSHN